MIGCETALMMKNEDFIALFMVFLLKQSLGFVCKVRENIIHCKMWSAKIIFYKLKSQRKSAKKEMKARSINPVSFVRLGAVAKLW